MKEFNKYFIVGTNSDALYDTMNGMVVDELIQCKDCDWFEESWCTFHGIEIQNEKTAYCFWGCKKVEL